MLILEPLEFPLHQFMVLPAVLGFSHKSRLIVFEVFVFKFHFSMVLLEFLILSI